MKRKILIVIILMFIIITFLSFCTKVKKPKEDIRGTEYNSNTIISYEILGQFSTKILDKSDNRIFNLNLAAQKINGKILMPNEEFSFNNTVGEASEENGFKKAITLDEKGNKLLDDGGGVCQISSTLYNAALKADMRVIERHSHSKDVGYVRKGKDAAIGYGVKDLRFINTENFPVRIRINVYSDKVEALIEKQGA